MRVVFLLILLAGLIGCAGRITIPEPSTTYVSRLPRQWEITTLYIRLPRDVNAYDMDIELAKTLCREFAIRVYDAFDGQAYLTKIVICNPSIINEKQAGVINLYQNGTIEVYRTETYMGSSPPDRPGYSYVPMPTSLLGIASSASSMMHEWLHAFIGLGDEYRGPHDLGGLRTMDCPENIDDRIATNACIMDNHVISRELCRKKFHNSKTDQGSEACYDQVVRVLAEHMIANLSVPSKTIPGPLNPPEIIIEVRLK